MLLTLLSIGDWGSPTQQCAPLCGDVLPLNTAIGCEGISYQNALLAIDYPDIGWAIMGKCDCNITLADYVFNEVALLLPEIADMYVSSIFSPHIAPGIR